MSVRITKDRTSRANSLNDLGIASGSDSLISVSEFTYKRNTTVFVEGDQVEYVYQVKSGAVRSYKSLPDGRRQIGAFHLENDIFGFDNGGVHRFSAEAVIRTTVRLIKRKRLDDLAKCDAVLFRNLVTMITANLQHAETHLLLLGRKTALERVAAFLHEMDDRITAADVLSLPMSRRDIADYLGLTLETVSRAVSKLRSEGIVHFAGHTQREIVIRDRERLLSFDCPAELCRAEALH